MKYVAAISAVAFAMVSGQAFAQTQNYPTGGLGDAWAQDQPSSIGITNGYDPSTGTYMIPHSGGRTTAPLPRYQAQGRGYPVGGLGDAQAQDEPTSEGFNNGYNPRVGAYPAPRTEGRSAARHAPRRYLD
jgi:hypothetical protein